MTGNAPLHHSDAAPSRRHAGFFMRAGRWLAIGVLFGAGSLVGLTLAATLLRAACVSMMRGGFGG